MTYLFPDPVVLVDGILVLGGRYSEEGGHSLAEVVTRCSTQTTELREYFHSTQYYFMLYSASVFTALSIFVSIYFKYYLL